MYTPLACLRAARRGGMHCLHLYRCYCIAATTPSYRAALTPPPPPPAGRRHCRRRRPSCGRCPGGASYGRQHGRPAGRHLRHHPDPVQLHAAQAGVAAGRQRQGAGGLRHVLPQVRRSWGRGDGNRGMGNRVEMGNGRGELGDGKPGEVLGNGLGNHAKRARNRVGNWEQAWERDGPRKRTLSGDEDSGRKGVK